MKRPLSPEDAPSTNEGENLFSTESIGKFQKEALWRQIQEYKESLLREHESLKEISAQKDGLFMILHFLLGRLKNNSGDYAEFQKITNILESNLLQVSSDACSSKVLMDLLENFRSGQFNHQALDLAKLASIEKSLADLNSYCVSLKHELELKDRKIFRLQMNSRKKEPRTVPDTLPTVSQEDDELSNITNVNENQLMKVKVLMAELEAVKSVSEERLAELSRVESEKSHYKRNFEIVEERLRRLPPGLEHSIVAYETLENQYHVLKDEFQKRKTSYEDLNRHVGETNSKRSHFISSLENELNQRRLAAKEFADNIEVDNIRLRKDRDHMRELYESSNMQVSALSKQNLHYQDLNNQLSARLALSDEKFKKIIKETKDSNESEAMILAEIESIAEAFDALQKQNAVILKQISEKDEAIIRISNEKLKAQFTLTQAQREADLTKQKALKIEIDSLKAAELAEAELKRLRILNDQLERNLLEKGTECEGLKWKLADLERQFLELRNRYDVVAKRSSETAISEANRLLDQANFDKKRLEERLHILSSKLEAYANSPGSAQTKAIQEELAIYKKLMKCNSCHTRDKNVVLTKCFHVFCKECIDTRIETRQRKCPNCSESFGVNDVKSIYL